MATRRAIVFTCLLLSLSLAAWPAWGGAKRPSAVKAAATRAMIERDVKRFTAMGGVYRPKGFVEFPNDSTPFTVADRIGSGLLGGRMIYYTPDGIQIRKNYYCDYRGTAFLQYWVPDGAGGAIPFAWQDAMFFCSSGGAPAGSNPLYVDIDADGKPEIRFRYLDDISVESSSDRALVRTFTGDILPSWVRAAAGDSLKRLSKEKLPAGSKYWGDDAYSVADPFDVGD